MVRSLTATSSLIHVYSCTESLSLSHLLSLCLPLLLACHLASSRLLSLSVVSPCFLITACPTQTLPVLQQLWWEMQSPCREVTRVGESLEWAKATTEVQAQAAPKTHASQLPSIASHQGFPLPTAFYLQPFPISFMRSGVQKSWFRPHFGVRSDLGETGDLVEHSERSCSHQGFPKTLLSEVVEVTYWPDCLFVFKSVSISEDLSPFWRLFLLFYSRILKAKVKQYVNNTVHCDCGSHHVITS